MPPAAWKWFTSAAPLGYILVIKGITSERSDMSSQFIMIPAALAMAIK